MNPEEFRKHAHQIADWMADYFENIESYDVMPDVSPGEIKAQIPASAPEEGEPFDAIFSDFKDKIMPGMTHWQHPSFFAYFNANASPPSVLAEMLTSTLGAQCMIWLTSPAAAELEERMMEWLRDLIGLPDTFTGVIQDTGSTSTLVALLTAREKATGFGINQTGFENNDFALYCSQEAHSSIDKAVRMAGFGGENLRKVPVDDSLALIPEELEKLIRADLDAGKKPLCIINALGTTGTLAIDPLKEVAAIAEKYDLWLHVDAAYAGSALILEEYKHLLEGIERVDSFFFNPHKWLFTNFDCSAYFVRDRESLVRTFSIDPSYLQTDQDRQVSNFRDWGPQLGRRFRALKLWFVLRSYGAEELRQMIRKHIEYGKWFHDQLVKESDFEIMATLSMNVVCYRYNPGDKSEKELEELNMDLMRRVNKSGKAFISQTRIDGKLVLRFVPGQTYTKKRHVEQGLKLILKSSKII